MHVSAPFFPSPGNASGLMSMRRGSLCGPGLWLCVALLLHLLLPGSTMVLHAQPSAEVSPWAGVGPVVVHAADGEAAARGRRAAELRYAAVARERDSGAWFAALVGVAGGDENRILRRFETWDAFLEFVVQEDPQIDVHPILAGGRTASRRLTAFELAERTRARVESPVEVRASWRGTGTNGVNQARVEFGLGAAATVREGVEAYARSRVLLASVHAILGARDELGAFSPAEQRHRARRSVLRGELDLTGPAGDERSGEPWVAAGLRVDARRNVVGVERFYTADELKARPAGVRGGGAGLVVEVRVGTNSTRLARPFVERGFTGRLEPSDAPGSEPGPVDWRLDPGDGSDPRTWTLLEFGEGEVLRRVAMARLSLIQAHVDRHRKLRAVRRSKLDLWVEPIIAGLNIGGGLSGLGAPAGDIARLAYNLVVSQMLPDVPDPKELRDLFVLFAAKQRDPALRGVPPDMLEESSVRRLREAGARLTEAEVEETLRMAGEAELRGMTRLARFERADGRYSSWVNILSSAAKVSGEAEEGLLRDIFNNPYFSLNGDLNLSTLLAVAIGQREASAFSRVSLEELKDGNGPAAAWARFFPVTVDLRAVVNTVASIGRNTMAERELKKPFPYAPRLGDLAAYEIRAFGFPLLMFHKRGRLLADAEAFENDFAYGFVGTRVVEQFATRAAFESEVRSGRMAPLGYVRVRSGRGGWQETRLAVFAHAIPDGPHQGKTALIVYGLKAFEEESALASEARERFLRFEETLTQGGSIERLLPPAPAAGDPAPAEVRPIVTPGTQGARGSFERLLGLLQEWRRTLRLTAWGGTVGDGAAVQAVRAELEQRGVEVGAADPLLGVDLWNSRFQYRSRDGVREITLIPSLAEARFAAEKASWMTERERLRKGALIDVGEPILSLHSAVESGGRLELGEPFAWPGTAAAGAPGVGLLIGQEAVRRFLSTELLPIQRGVLFAQAFRPTPLTLRRGTNEVRVFVQVEFPGREVVDVAVTDPESGVLEIQRWRGGLLERSSSESTVVEREYDPAGLEVGSRTFANAGTTEQPVRGDVVEETRTVGTWMDAPAEGEADPVAPRIQRLRLNHITGRRSVETYGILAQPVEVTDERRVFRNSFDPAGRVRVGEGRLARLAGGAAGGTPSWNDLLNAGAGALVEEVRRVPLDVLPAGWHGWFPARPYQALEVKEVLRGVSRRLLVDPGNRGRTAGVFTEELLPGDRTVVQVEIREFSSESWAGEVPKRTTVRSLASGRLVAKSTTLSLDPAERSILTWERTLHGQEVTNRYLARWDVPVESRTALRTTTRVLDDAGTTVAARVADASTGEVISESSGRFDPATARWNLETVVWLKPGTALRQERESRSPRGRLLEVLHEDGSRTRVHHDADGLETGRERFRTGADGTNPVLLSAADSYRWDAGSLTLTQRQLDGGGRVLEQYEQVRDAEGRVVLDRVHRLDGLETMTRVAYHAASERATRATEEWNGQTFSVRTPLGEPVITNAQRFLPIRVEPAFGLVSTQYVRMGDPAGRVAWSVDARGARSDTLAWVGDGSVALRSEKRNRSGRPVERRVFEGVRTNAAAIPLWRYRRELLDPWGAPTVVELMDYVAGTEATALAGSGGEETIFEWQPGFPIPVYTLPTPGEQGLDVRFPDGRTRWVSKLHFWKRLPPRAPRVSGTQPNPPGAAVEVRTLDLNGSFYHAVSIRILDSAGGVIERRQARVRLGQETGRSWADLRRIAEGAEVVEVAHHRFEPGVLVEQGNPGARTLQFFRSAPAGSAFVEPVNVGGVTEFPTEIELLRAAVGDWNEAPEVRRYIRRRYHDARFAEANPYMPGQAAAWTAWSFDELGVDGRSIFSGEQWFAGDGTPRTELQQKQGADGVPAAKVAWLIAPSIGTNGNPIGTLPATLPSPGPVRSNILAADFVYWLIDGPGAGSFRIAVKDRRGQVLPVVRAGTPSSRASVPAWPLNGDVVRWIPDDQQPKLGLSVDAMPVLKRVEGVICVAVADLVTAGVDPTEQDIFMLEAAPGSIPEPGVRVQGPFLLGRLGDPNAGAQPSSRALWSTIQTRDGLGAAMEFGPGLLGQGNVVRWPVTARGQLHSVPLYRVGIPAGALNPILTILDGSSGDGPRPLYSMDVRDGHLMAHYKVIRREDTHVYTIVNGFEIPRFEVFRSASLLDELGPSWLGYGYNYDVQIPMVRRPGWLGRQVATLENRLSANIFRSLGEQWIGGLPEDDATAEQRAELSYPILHRADRQAETLRHLPSVSEAFINRQAVPWGTTNPPATPVDPIPVLTRAERRKLALKLLRAHVHGFPGPGTGLIPTAPGTVVERYVDTVAEARIIELATALGEHGIVRDLMEFYWTQTRGGTELVHAFYDGQAGTAMAAAGPFLRPLQSERTAECQVAMAEAAFRAGFAMADARMVWMGRNLLMQVLARFRPPAIPGDARGVAETEYFEPAGSLGLSAWSEPPRYRLRTNARVFLVIDQLLREESARFVLDGSWRQQLERARNDQEKWLRRHAIEPMLANGTPPSGSFEILDIRQGTRAVAEEKWSDAAGWLELIEVTRVLGFTEEQLTGFLDALWRVHAHESEGVWGLDWGFPFVRPAVLSSELTARFASVAARAGHHAAAAFVRASMERWREPEGWPVLRGRGLTQQPVPSGQGGSFHPLRNLSGLDESGGQRAVRWPVALEANSAALVPAVWKQESTIHAYARYEGAAKNVSRSDLAFFLFLAGGFYIAVLLAAIFWWRFRKLRSTSQGLLGIADQLVPESVMQLSEERWAKRVLGSRTPAGAPHTRYSNAPVEMNFHMQFRSIYKLTLEWRRQENGWDEDDSRLVEDESDPWLNGLDELAAVAGVYMRWVVKAGAKDGFRRSDVLRENEDSNHIWSRLVMFFSEFHWGLLGLMRQYNNVVLQQDKAEINTQIRRLLESMGVRERSEACDGRVLYDAPARPGALDLMVLQRPGATLESVCREVARGLNAPLGHVVGFIEKYKEFKRREEPQPIHPYLIECAKLLPHFLIMGLGALVWYNQSIGDRPILPYLGEVAADLALSPTSLIWGAPLLGGLVCGILAHFIGLYRFDARMSPGESTGMVLDATITSLFSKKQSAMPTMNRGRWWNPRLYERLGWGLRAFGYTGLAIAFLNIDAPSFVTFLITRGLVAMLALLEVMAVVLPILSSWTSHALQDWVTDHPNSPGWLRFINRLNFTATRPASPLWLSIKYHFKPSVPMGDPGALIQSILVYFLMAGGFFAVGAFLCQEILSLWFTEKYVAGEDWRLWVGGFLFWNTMYLLRYGLFLMLSGLATSLTNWPIRTLSALATIVWVLPALLEGGAPIGGTAGWFTAAVLIGLALAEERITTAFRLFRLRFLAPRPDGTREERLHNLKRRGEVRFGVVYMSGDDLSSLKLTPALLMTRWQVLRDQLEATGLSVLSRAVDYTSDAQLAADFTALHDAERAAKVTLWHPDQVIVAGQTGGMSPTLGLTLEVSDPDARKRILRAWHARRWLVTMMSTAGHSQDTAINMVDMAVRIAREGLAGSAVFYLLQNKYDGSEHNRPSQTDYETGELAQREKLALLLESLAPGLKAHCVQNWTPFGFKAGGLTGMDLIHEEALRLNTMLILDRNANVHDLDALMEDLKDALVDPDLVIIIPGRGTTNTRTPIGQASQLVEEGHRSFLKGLMGLMGGRAAEGVGTGWGNLIAVFYGRVQRAMVDVSQAKMPVTSRMKRGASFATRTEGLIGFAPHAVGISEDTWAVSQATHNAMAIGRTVKYALSRAIWHKIRETWSHAEWLASFPRWAGGYVQMMHDPLMQMINDFGPAPVFCKEVRACSGRNFLTAIFALGNIVLMPLAILLDVTPFVQILLVLWNFGFVMNQILTVHGLHAYLEGCGFQRSGAFSGALLTGALCLIAGEPIDAWSAPATVVGFLTGGFWIGFIRWVYTRVRDVLLFGPQLVLNALGQFIRQTLEFTVSGASPEDAKGVNMAFRAAAGPREDRPLDAFPSILNLRTVVWGFGFVSLVLNLFALSNLDLVNALLLLPSLMFCVSVLAGPFLMKPRVGHAIGLRVVVPKFLGWVAGILLFTSVSLMIAQGGVPKLIGVLLFVGSSVGVLLGGLRYARYQKRLQALHPPLLELLRDGGIADAQAAQLTTRILHQALGPAPALQTFIAGLPLSPPLRDRLQALVQERIVPVLRAPVADPRTGRFANSRFASEWCRSFVLSKMTLVWLFVVPIPGILIFTAGDYRISVALQSLNLLLLAGVVAVILGSWLGWCLEWVEQNGVFRPGLVTRGERTYKTFEALALTPGKLTSEEISRTFAALTDFKTYLDQRSYGYARACLRGIEQTLKTARNRPPSPPA